MSTDSGSSDESLPVQQDVTGDRNQVIGQAVSSTIVNVMGGGHITIYQPQLERSLKAEPESPSTIGPNPYKGLMAFQETDGDRFFGREKQIEQLWNKLRELHEEQTAVQFLPIYGPSGSGKSSLVRAGLIPELARHPLPGYARARVAVLVPGTHPLEALATVLVRVATDDQTPAAKTREFVGELEQANQNNEYDGLRRIADVFPDITISPLIVVVDQLEEIYTLCEAQDERDAFVANLLCAAGDRARRVSVIVTLRSDFLGETQKHAVLNRLFSEQGYLVPAMSPEELRQAIAKPAELAEHPLDAATIDLLVKDAEGREGALPLLQFALECIWEGLAEGKAPVETLKAINGVGGALAGKAQQIYDSLDDERKAIARRLFLGLVHLGEGTKDTRRRASLDSLISHQDQPMNVKQVIHLFAAPGVRLITLSTENNIKTVEVTHEALFGHWNQLRSWLEGSRSDLRFQRRLDEAARYWNEQGRPEGNLWRSPDLDSLQQFFQRASDGMTLLQVEFFQASKRTKNIRKLLQKLSVGGLLAGLFFLIYQLQVTQRQNVEQLVITSKLLLEQRQQLDALIEIVRASKKFRTLINKKEIKEALVENLQQAVYGVYEKDHLNIFREPSVASTISFDINPDGDAVIGISNGDLKILNYISGEETRFIPRSHSDSVNSVNFSPDGKTIASGSSDSTVKLWNRNGQQLKTFSGHSDSVNSVNFSPDGKTIASGSSDSTVKLWNRNGQQLKTFSGHSDSVNSVNFSPDGKTIASGSSDGTIKLWNRNGQQLKTFSGHSDSVNSVNFSPDGKTIASGSSDSTVKLWNRNGQQLKTFSGHNTSIQASSIRTVKFALSNHYLVFGDNYGFIKSWNLANSEVITLGVDSSSINNLIINKKNSFFSLSNSGFIRKWNTSEKEVRVLPHSGLIWATDISPDGAKVASAGIDGAIQIWNLRTGKIINFIGHAGSINTIKFSSDSRALISGSDDSSVRIWDADNGSLKITLNPSDVWVRSISIDLDGSSKIAAGSADGIIKTWSSKGKQETAFDTAATELLNAIIFSPGGSKIASGGDDGVIKLWSLKGQKLMSFNTKGKIKSLSFSSDSNKIAVAYSSGYIKILDLTEKRIVNSFRAHSQEINTIHFIDNDNFLLSASSDGTSKVFSLAGEERLIIQDIHPIRDVSFNQFNSLLVLVSGKSVKILKINRDMLQQGTRKAYVWKISDLDNLTLEGCNWLIDYLSLNRSAKDKNICRVM
ncbi:AAA family ATPase [Trichocoleus desertorum AS-A10]|uniref:nSTAND1 domain-containing NTPase n=1 Tax=Trichocoleus desertorum TaxID=1481672 RepID=UPI003296936E